MTRRRFNASERAALYLAADGRCEMCGTELEPGWHADHIHPHSRGGKTDVINGQALCPTCNLKKGNNVTKLYDWQQEAIDRFYLHEKPDYLVSATPGAGKTTFSLTLAGRLIKDGTVRRVMVVVPTDALREQWADNATRHGLELIPVSDPADYEKAGYDGFVVTYQQLATGSNAMLARRATRVPTVAILDEIHHAGEKRKWGEALRAAAGEAVHRIALTGTPWRRDKKEPIPFIEYDENGLVVVDHPYEYGAAVADGVCRRIEFHAYDGEAKWIDHARAQRNGGSAIFTAQVGADMNKDDVSAAMDAIYHPNHSWMPSVLAEADVILEDLRVEVPDAAGLVIAQEKRLAEAYADILARITGKRPPVVVSDEEDPGSKKAKATIDRFRTSREKWIVAVKMISEGVDIPRLAVGVYASKTQTPLFFRQVVGRFVRVRPGEEFNAKLLIPAFPDLIKHAREIEDELRHQLDFEEQQERQERERNSGQTELPVRMSIGASEATYDRAIFQGQEISPELMQEARAKCVELGIPVQYAINLLPLLGGGMSSAPKAQPSPNASAQARTPRHRAEAMLRNEVDALAGRLARLRCERGQEPSVGAAKHAINQFLFGKFAPRNKASLEQLKKMRAYLEREMGQA